jgi:proteasome lid subunit RPN8/RPN11
MISFIHRIIRAFAPRDYVLICSRPLWRTLTAELDRRGGRRHEAGAFLLGTVAGDSRRATEVVYYDELDPHAYDSGVCMLAGDAFVRLWDICRKRGLTVVADVHTHPGQAFQSRSDRTNPMVAQPGHVAIILPDYAKVPVDTTRIGVFEYCGDHKWTDRSPVQGAQFLRISRWR